MRLHPLCVIAVVVVLVFAVRVAHAVEPVAVVIGEVAWAGSDRSANDEWIELSAVGEGAARSLSGWTVTSLRSSGQEDIVVRFGSGHLVQPGMAHVVLRLPSQESRVSPEPLLVASALSLPNAKLRLRLKNEHGETVDTVDDGSGSPFAGANPSGGIGRASMERIDLRRPGDDPENWRTSVDTIGFSQGAAIFGTPGTPPVAPPPDEHDSEPTAAVQAPTQSGACLPEPPQIIVQSGPLRAEESLSINVMATDDPRITACAWTYGDGATADTCNPRSHRYDRVGQYQLVLATIDSCGVSAEASLSIVVTEKKTGSQTASCMPSSFTGVVISEFLPRPESGGEEWIELWNGSGKEQRLCGWQLDDDEGGSTPFSLDGLSIADDGWLVLDRSVTSLTLNDDRDVVRLVGPAIDGGQRPLVERRSYEHALVGQSMALRDDGSVLWTPEQTPGSANQFREPEDVAGMAPLCFRSALPAPGENEEAWVTLSNCSGRPQFLDAFSLAAIFSDGALGTARTRFPQGAALHAGEVLTLDEEALGWTLADDDAGIALLDAHGNIWSVLTWQHPARGVVVTAPMDGDVQAHIETIDDNGVIGVRVLASGPSAQRLPPAFRVLPAGVRLPEDPLWSNHAVTRIRSIAADHSALLRFGSVLQGIDGVLRAELTVDPEGIALSSVLVREGLAQVDEGHLDAASMLPYQAEAKRELRGLWTMPEALAELRQRSEQNAVIAALNERGVHIIASMRSGRVLSGAMLILRPSIDGALFVSVNSGAYRISSGVLRINENMAISAYVSVPIPGTEALLRSPIWHGEYLPVRSTTEAVLMSEIQPRSFEGAPEWIELLNPGADPVDLAGWMLDDIDAGGSRPWVVPMGTVLKPYERLLFTKDQTHVTLNDNGDDVRLLRPDGSIADAVTLPAMKKLETWARFGLRWCATTLPTPGQENVCRKPSIKLPTVRKTAARKAARATTALAVDRFPVAQQAFFGFQKHSVGIPYPKILAMLLCLAAMAQAGAWWLVLRR